MKIRKSISIPALMIFLSAIVSAQSGGIFSVTQSVVAGGGGQSVTAGIFSLDYTLGQALAGDMATGSPYEISPGFWPASPSAITGNVIYGNAVSGPPPPRYVSNVLISAAGSPAVSIFTDFPGGAYSLSGFGPGAIGVSFGGQYEIVPVPEPATTALIGAVALCALIGYRERRRFTGIRSRLARK